MDVDLNEPVTLDVSVKIDDVGTVQSIQLSKGFVLGSSECTRVFTMACGNFRFISIP